MQTSLEMLCGASCIFSVSFLFISKFTNLEQISILLKVIKAVKEQGMHNFFEEKMTICRGEQINHRC